MATVRPRARARRAATHPAGPLHLAEIGEGNVIPGGEKLPDGLKDLVTRSLRLHERIIVMDKMLNSKMQEKAANQNPVATQLDQLAKAFARG